MCVSTFSSSLWSCVLHVSLSNPLKALKPQQTPEKVPPKVSDEEVVLGIKPEKISETAPGKAEVKEKTPERVAEKMPESRREDVPKTVTERIPEKLPEKTPDKRPDKIPEKIPEKLLEKTVAEKKAVKPPEKKAEEEVISKKKPLEKVPGMKPKKQTDRTSEGETVSVETPEKVEEVKPEVKDTLKKGTDEKNVNSFLSLCLFTKHLIRFITHLLQHRLG